MFRLGRMTRRVALLAFVTVLAAAAILVGSGTFGSGATDTPAPWRLLPRAPLTFDAGQTSVWTGSELIVSGLTGAGADGNLLDSTEAAWRTTRPRARGAASQPRTDTYCRRPPSGPAGRCSSGVAFAGLRSGSRPPAASRTAVRRRDSRRTGPGNARLGRRLLRSATARGEAFDPGTETWRTIADSPLAPSSSRSASGRAASRALRQRDLRGRRKAAPARARARSCVRPGDRHVAPDRAAPRVPCWCDRRLERSRDPCRRRPRWERRAGRSRVGHNPTTTDWRRLPMEPGRIRSSHGLDGKPLAGLGRRRWSHGARTGARRALVRPGKRPLDAASVAARARTDAIAAWTGRELVGAASEPGTAAMVGGWTTAPRSRRDRSRVTRDDLRSNLG